MLLPGYAGYPNTAAGEPVSDECRCGGHRGMSRGALVGLRASIRGGNRSPLTKPCSPPTPTSFPSMVALGKIDYLEIVAFADHQATAGVLGTAFLNFRVQDSRRRRHRCDG